MRLARQKGIIRDLLLSRGPSGFTAREAIYDHGITRAATYVHELRKEGWPIDTETKPGETARYWLTGDPPGVERPDQTVIWSEV